MTASVTRNFKRRSKTALLDGDLREAMTRAKAGFQGVRKQAIEALPEYDQLRDAANEIREHTLNNLDFYLELFEENVVKNGGQVHWAANSEEFNRIVLDICKQAGAQLVTKGKSMVTEETGLNEVLINAGIERMETDLGEYIIQLADEPPSHIIAPAVHKTREQITELFHEHHQKFGITEKTEDRAALVSEARKVLRESFINADVGITGANFLIAETGSNVLVTNEGNGDLTSNLPKVHIVAAGLEKVIPGLEDLSVFLRLLARNAAGQEMSVYTTLYSGPARTTDRDGPGEYHVVLLDNGRSSLLGSEFRDMLRCIRCGACLNHCPVYSAIGGHSYGWVYSGPMGSVLTPLFNGLEQSYDLPNACTLNGRCKEVCPMRIPLSDMMRKLRQKQTEAGIGPTRQKRLLRWWGFFARHPRLYRWSTRLMVGSLGWLGRKKGRIGYVPGAGGWTRHRDLPVSTRGTFMQQYKRENP